MGHVCTTIDWWVRLWTWLPKRLYSAGEERRACSQLNWLIENYVGIQTAVNEGALFGMGAGFGTMFAILSVIAGLGILVWLSWFGAIESWWLSIALGCVMAGIFGNLYDRLGLWWQSDYPPEWRSGVRDWILLCYKNYTWPNFNIADSLLVTGAVMLAIHSFQSPPKNAENGAAKS